jgi:hypothetical protein
MACLGSLIMNIHSYPRACSVIYIAFFFLLFLFLIFVLHMHCMSFVFYLQFSLKKNEKTKRQKIYFLPPFMHSESSLIFHVYFSTQLIIISWNVLSMYELIILLMDKILFLSISFCGTLFIY